MDLLLLQMVKKMLRKLRHKKTFWNDFPVGTIVFTSNNKNTRKTCVETRQKRVSEANFKEEH